MTAHVYLDMSHGDYYAIDPDGTFLCRADHILDLAEYLAWMGYRPELQSLA